MPRVPVRRWGSAMYYSIVIQPLGRLRCAQHVGLLVLEPVPVAWVLVVLVPVLAVQVQGA